MRRSARRPLAKPLLAGDGESAAALLRSTVRNAEVERSDRSLPLAGECRTIRRRSIECGTAQAAAVLTRQNVVRDGATKSRPIGPPDSSRAAAGAIIGTASEQAKALYSAASSFTALGCAAAVGIAWGALARIGSAFESEWVPLLLSALIVYAYAYVLPEPPGYPHAGELKPTPAELIFGFFNLLIVFATVLGVKEGFDLF
jgi:hypothetical protein